MIYFRGKALESVAPVMVEDIRVSPIPRTPLVRDRPIQGGADFVRMHDGTRTITITFGLLVQDPEARQNSIDAITRWALSDQPAPMQLPYRNNRMIDVICTSLPEPSARQWWESRLAITFVAYEPYFYASEEKSAACGTAFYVAGDAPPAMWITRTVASASTGDYYSDGTDIMFFSAIPAGNLVVDLNRQTIAVSGTSIMSSLMFNSSFIIPRTGSITINGTGTVHWRERWRS